MAVISCAKYLHDLHATVIKISSFFILSKKNEKGVSDISVSLYRVAQNKIPDWRICNISATGGLILKILKAT